MDFKFSVKVWLRFKKKTSLNLYNWGEWAPWMVYEAGKFETRGDTGLQEINADMGGVALPESFRFWENVF